MHAADRPARHCRHEAGGSHFDPLEGHSDVARLIYTSSILVSEAQLFRCS